MSPRQGNRSGSTVWFKFLSPFATWFASSVTGNEHKKSNGIIYMKKALILVVLMVIPTMAFAQGTVVFNNQTGSVTVNGTLPYKGDVYVELFSAPAGAALLNQWVPNYAMRAWFLAANPGWAAAVPFNGGQNPGGLTENGIFGLGNQHLNVPGGANAEYFVLGWTRAGGGAIGTGTTYDAARAAGNYWFGESAIYTTATGDPTTTPAVLPVDLKNTFGGLIIEGPEPTTMALAGLGALLLLLFRRRR
jgi:hypothetical protein